MVTAIVLFYDHIKFVFYKFLSREGSRDDIHIFIH